MLNLVPEIGLPTLYGKRTKRHSRTLRKITWELLLTELTTYPTIVIPARPNGIKRHAFCVVDDLIFDSTTPKALKLEMDSIKWLFDEVQPDIYHVFRFNMKYSPPGSKVLTFYRREVSLHWSCTARPFFDRNRSRIQQHKNPLVYIDSDGKEHHTDITVHREKKSKPSTGN